MTRGAVSLAYRASIGVCWSSLLVGLGVLGGMGCGSTYPDAAHPVVEEDESSMSAAPTGTASHDDALDAHDPALDDDEDLKPKVDPTDDLGDPRDQKHEDEPK